MNDFLVELANLVYGFRKFLAFVFVISIACIFRIKNYIEAPGLVELLKDVTISFFASNSVEHITSTIKQYTGNNKPIEKPIYEELVNNIEAESVQSEDNASKQ